MNIGVFGRGFVGSALIEAMQTIGHKVYFYDPKYEEQSDFINTVESDIIFIAVPTNPKEDGSCDISIVEVAITNILTNRQKKNPIIAIKSTISPGTTYLLNHKYKTQCICHVPEFLRERCAISDMLDNMDTLIVGTYSSEIGNKVIESFKWLPKKSFIVTPIEAELCKYFNNVYNALRIIFANGFYEVCKKVGADYQKIYNIMKNRSNISGHYLKCSENLRGFDGYCLPKDTEAFVNFVKSLELDSYPEIFEVIIKDNKKYPKHIIDGMRSFEEAINGQQIKNLNKEN